MCHAKDGVNRTPCHCHKGSNFVTTCHKLMVLNVGFEDGPYNNHKACIAAALDVQMTSLQVYIRVCGTRDIRNIASQWKRL